MSWRCGLLFLEFQYLHKINDHSKYIPYNDFSHTVSSFLTREMFSIYPQSDSLTSMIITDAVSGNLVIFSEVDKTELKK